MNRLGGHLKRGNLGPPSFVTAVATLYEDTNKCSKDGPNTSAGLLVVVPSSLSVQHHQAIWGNMKLNLSLPTNWNLSRPFPTTKNTKSLVEEGIPPGIFKTCLLALLDPLTKLLCLTWDPKTFFKDWKTSFRLPIPKKGHRSIYANWRVIGLIDTAAKLFATVLPNRFGAVRDVRTRSTQCGICR